jgi:hypothetical protein
MSDRRMSALSTMTRTRIMTGLLSVIHGIGAYCFNYGVGLSGVVRHDQHGWLWSFFLILFGGMMLLSAIAEMRGCTQRWSRELSASLLSVTWLGVFFYSFEGGADTITLLAPVMFGACLWSWIAESKVARVVAQREDK